MRHLFGPHTNGTVIGDRDGYGGSRTSRFLPGAVHEEKCQQWEALKKRHIEEGVGEVGVGGLSLINKLQEVFILRRREGERGRRVGKGAKEEGRGGDTPNVVKADMIFDTNKRILH
jgi:hypothetical protein